MFSAIDEIFRDFSKHAPAPALVYAVSKNGKILHSRAVGYLDLEKKSPCQESSLFRIASMSKSFAAVAAMILRDEGRLDLNAPPLQSKHSCR
jgi:CubicO group peptidase (beta-lactamase class C family)